jgi:hypothetical protein
VNRERTIAESLDARQPKGGDNFGDSALNSLPSRQRRNEELSALSPKLQKKTAAFRGNGERGGSGLPNLRKNRKTA